MPKHRSWEAGYDQLAQEILFWSISIESQAIGNGSFIEQPEKRLVHVPTTRQHLAGGRNLERTLGWHPDMVQ